MSIKLPKSSSDNAFGADNSSESRQAIDEKYMRRCLDLAASAEGRTSPNPMVGSVVLSALGEVIGEGYHKRAGLAHAEVEALNVAQGAAQAGNTPVASATRGGTLYVNLEPCCHFGRTPPCADRVIASGVKRVVIGCTDPNPKVAGGGLKALRDAGIEVVEGVLESQCRYLNRGFFKSIATGLPWLALKMALSLDGRIADRSGSSRYISGAHSRELVMKLRNRFDCVLIGANTARLDNPTLDVRGLEDGRNPLRVVIDPNLSVPQDARMFHPPGETILFALPAGNSAVELPERVKIVELPGEGQKELNLAEVLRRLRMEGVQSVLCEGGGRLAGALLDRGLVDELYWFVAPRMLVDASALPAVASSKMRSLTDAIDWEILGAHRSGGDILSHAISPRHKGLMPRQGEFENISLH
jgi:diaminohydroxyphosphoribosylaminopyrimidine deaminase/5-amino-6-(5-phosphoribosylamino)uracil reductase